MAGDRGASLTVLARRLGAQLLSGTPARDPLTVVARLLAVQAQDGRGARLAVRARSEGITVAAVDRALNEERSLLITWLGRGTLHLVRAEDYPWLHSLTTPPLFKGNARRLAQLGVSPRMAERGVEVIARALAADGPLTRSELKDRLVAARVLNEGQALVHLLLLASLHGVAVRGPMIGRQHAYVLVRDWLGPQPAVERDRALVELARRYLVGHAPAQDRDLAKWAGLPLRDARAGLAAIASELSERRDGLLELRHSAPPARKLPPPRLLGAYEPVLMGWTTRAPITGEHDHAIVSGGLFRPFALVDGRAAATWRLDGRRVVLEPLAGLDPADAASLAADGEQVVRYLEL